MKLESVRGIVTGAAGGLGMHFCKSIIEAGGRVVAGDVDVERLHVLKRDLARQSDRFHMVPLDVTDDEQAQAFVQEAHAFMRGVNLLINNAAIARDGLLVRRDRASGIVDGLSHEIFQSVIDVNLTGATMMVRHVVERMVADKKQGLIVNMSSLARHGNRGQSSYVAAKAALSANSMTWAREFAPFGIRVVAVAPGVVDTPMTAQMSSKSLARLVSMIPLGRMATPDEIWLGVKFAIENDYFNGRTLDIDGGLVVGWQSPAEHTGGGA